jgi:hypothetical protein
VPAFTLDRGFDQHASAYLDLGEVAGDFTVTINGTVMGQLDQLNTVVDLGPYVKRGLNRVAVRVESTLYHRVVGPGKAYGMLGNGGAVPVMPYRILPIGSSETQAQTGTR